MCIIPHQYKWGDSIRDEDMRDRDAKPQTTSLHLFDTSSVCINFDDAQIMLCAFLCRFVFQSPCSRDINSPRTRIISGSRDMPPD